jgi:hypothetical protein
MADINAQNIVVGLDSSGVDAGVAQVKQSIGTLGGAAQQAGAAMAGVGDATDKAFKQSDAVVKVTQRSINAFVSQIKNSIIDVKALRNSTNSKPSARASPRTFTAPMWPNCARSKPHKPNWPRSPCRQARPSRTA